MKIKRIMCLLGLTALLSSVLTGCGARTKETEVKKESEIQTEGSEITIGLAQYSLGNEFQTKILENAQKAADDLGITLLSYDGQNDASVQISQVETMIANGVDAIVLVPQDADACVPCAEAAAKAGVPFIVANSRINTDIDTASVVTNDIVGGEMELEYLIEYMGRDDFNVAIIDGILGHAGQLDRSEGYDNILKKHPDINVICEGTANWTRAQAMELMESWIITYGEKIDAVLAQNDEMGLGAKAALDSAGLTGVPVIGVDGIAEGIEAVKNGVMIATLYQDAEIEGYDSVVQAYNAATGKGAKDNFVDLILITPENVDEFIQ